MAETDAEKMARLEKDLADSRQQLSGLSNERNAYRQKAEAWEKNVGSHLGDMLKMDPATGLPMGVDPGTDPATQGGANPHPLAGFSSYVEGFQPAQADAYYTRLFQSQGFLTAEQAQGWADKASQTAYQAARGDMLVMRNYDRLTGQEKYKELGNPDSELSKRTGRILQERKLAEPLNGAKTFDGWRYANLEALQMGADLARLELHEESVKNAQAGQAGQAAGMASGGASQGSSPVTAEQWESALSKGDVTAMKELIGGHVASVTGAQP